MIKRIEKWLASIFQREINSVKIDAAGLYQHVTDEVATLDKKFSSALADLTLHTEKLTANLSGDMAAAIADLKSHVTAEIEKPVEAIAQSVETEITKQFENILSMSKVAAQEALADARKVLRMPCEICKAMSWRFTVDAGGKVVCGNCAQKGKA